MIKCHNDLAMLGYWAAQMIAVLKSVLYSHSSVRSTFTGLCGF